MDVLGAGLGTGPLDKSTGSADAADPDDASADLGVVAGTTKIFFFFAGAAGAGGFKFVTTCCCSDSDSDSLLLP